MVAFNSNGKEDGAELMRSADGFSKGRILNFTVKVESKTFKAYLFGPIAHSHGDSYSILIKDGKEPIAGVTLFEEKGLPFSAYSVGDAGVVPKWIGHGIMRVVYEALVVDYDFALVGFSHSPGARKTWSRLAAQSDIVAYAADKKGFYRAFLSPTKYIYEDDLGNKQMMGEGKLVLLVKKGGTNDRYISHVVKERRRFSKMLYKPDITHDEVIKVLNEPAKRPPSVRKYKLGGITRR